MQPHDSTQSHTGFVPVAPDAVRGSERDSAETDAATVGQEAVPAAVPETVGASVHTGVHTAIDPRIDRDEHEALLRPIVRPAEEPEDDVGFARSLTLHVLDSWHHSAAEETLHDWPEAVHDPEVQGSPESYRFEDLTSAPQFPTTTYFPPDAGGGARPWSESPSDPPSDPLSDHSLSADRRASRWPVQSGVDTPVEPGLGEQDSAGVGTAPRQSGRRSIFPGRLLAQKLIRPVSQATGQMSTLDWLSGTPFENPHQAQEPGEADELVTINLVLDLGEALFRYGAGALEVETSILAVTSAFGMKNTDVDITNQSIILNWSPPGKIPYSRVRVVRSWSANFRALSEVHTLVTDIAFGRITRAEAEETLQDIIGDPKPYPRWVVATAGALFAGLFASYTGAPLLDASLGFLATLLVLAVTRQLTIWRVPEIFTLAVGGFLATAVALCALTLGAPITTSMVVAGGLMILLPSVRIVSAIQDAINAFPITAAGRLVSSLVAFSGLTAGIMVGVVLTGRAGAPELDVTQEIMRIYHPGVLAALVFLTAITASVVQQAPYRLLLPTGAVAALGFAGVSAGEIMGFGGWFTPILGATVVGALARVVALRLRAPQLVVAVPAMMFMLPGLIVFRGMYQIAISESSVSRTAGLYEIFDALIIIMAIAAGIVLGDVLMRPLTKRLQSNERTKGRRR
ncbi:threonine/serine exporter family protein [Nesterenkonia sp. CF4.4]|uniref:threonine/serine ThrE exporter family protein n=1 Tax=Nesterenkonia sp. CF4.4 TaxID=3373079 RepID=UPI003EE611A0